MIMIILWVLVSCILGAVASKTGRTGFLWGLLSLLISPLFAGLLLLLAYLMNGSKVSTVMTTNVKFFQTYEQAYDYVAKNYPSSSSAVKAIAAGKLLRLAMVESDIPAIMEALDR